MRRASPSIRPNWIRYAEGVKQVEPILLWQAHNANASLSPAIEALRREVEDELSEPRRQVRTLLERLMGGRADAQPQEPGEIGATDPAQVHLSVDAGLDDAEVPRYRPHSGVYPGSSPVPGNFPVPPHSVATSVRARSGCTNHEVRSRARKTASWAQRPTAQPSP